ncbi:MAG: discoidin domain-containing protein [Spirochaetales bacterium]|nr:discoidin domain-containing protein [Spirochaetales bacterium]
MKSIFPAALSLVLLLSCADDKKLFHATVAEVKASSFVVESVLAYGRYHPLQALDGDPLTAWNEGAKGPGIGEWIEIDFEKPVKADEIRLMPGYYDPAWYKQNNRIKSLEIALDGKTMTAALTDGMDEKTIALNNEAAFSRMRYTITGVHKGTKYDDTCLSEIDFYLHKRKIELNTEAPKAKLAADDKQAQIASKDSPMGKMIVATDYMTSLPYTEYYFDDFTYVEILYSAHGSIYFSKIIGKWSISTDYQIEIKMFYKCQIIGSGKCFGAGTELGNLFENYKYEVRNIQKTAKINWMKTREDIENQPEDYLFRESIKKIGSVSEQLKSPKKTIDIEETIKNLEASFKKYAESSPERLY